MGLYIKRWSLQEMELTYIRYRQIDFQSQIWQLRLGRRVELFAVVLFSSKYLEGAATRRPMELLRGLNPRSSTLLRRGMAKLYSHGRFTRHETILHKGLFFPRSIWALTPICCVTDSNNWETHPY